MDKKSRIKGAVMGAFIGDALALGPHWYYNLDEMCKAYGSWVDNYTDPKAGRYHKHLKAGDSSQAGVILALTLRSLIANKGYRQEDFCHRLDTELFPLLDGTPNQGPGGYTSQSIREVYQKRQQGKAWGSVAGLADNTEAAERILAIAVYYSSDPGKMAEAVSQNVALTQKDPTVAAMTLAYAAVLAQLIEGRALDKHLSGHLMVLVQKGQLPFYSLVKEGVVPVGEAAPLLAGQFASPDALLTVSSIAEAVQDRGVVIEPAWKVGLLYGLPCAVYHQFPAVYHLAARFQNDFENAVLNAVNAGGQNMACAMLTGALCGAIGGFEAIPKRFVDGLSQVEEYLALADALADLVV